MGLQNLSKEGLSSLLDKFQGKKLLVIGDLIVSRFVEVAARKLSREAPVPAGDYIGETFLPGGAANLAREVSALGSSVSVIGSIGDDEYGRWLTGELDRNGISHSGVLLDCPRPTSLRNLGINLMSRLDCKSILITRGDEGLTLFEKENVTNFPPLGGKKNMFSKVGVRDAMTGVFSLAVASGGNVYEATALSNVAGAVRSDLPRNATLSVPELAKQVEEMGDFLQRIAQAPVRR